jgi:hypothetical protein
MAGLAAAAACGGSAGSPSSPTPTVAPSPSPTVPSVLTPKPTEVAAAEPVAVVDLASESPLLTIRGGDAGDLQAGGVSAATGDFNSDGVDDLLVGAPFADGPDNSRPDAGEAYVIFGPRAEGGEIDLGTGSADVTVLGALPGDNLGFSVMGADLNADGIDDIVVGAPGSNGLTNIRTDLGEAYVIFGDSSLGGTVDLAEVEQDFTFRPAEGFTRVGTSFAAGDVNGDGADDLIAGGPFGGRVEGTSPGGPRTSEGEVYVVFGTPGLSGEKDVARGEEDVRLKGATAWDGFGRAVATGDVNGDGVDDIVVGASSADGPDESRTEGGEAHVFFGSPALAGKVDSADADVTILGAEAGDSLGDAVVIGDLNGDGLADIVLSAHFADGPDDQRATSGEAYVIFGSSSLGGVIDLAEDAPGAVVYGRDDDDFMPWALALADVDGDGRDDLALGAAFGDGPDNSRPDAGEAYVLLGNALHGDIDLRVDVEGPVFIYGAALGEEMGTSLLWLDLNHDSRQELLLLAPGREGTAEASGRLYLVKVPEG